MHSNVCVSIMFVCWKVCHYIYVWIYMNIFAYLILYFLGCVVGSGAASSSSGGGVYGHHAAGGGNDDSAPSLEPPDVFCALGSLIVEGRIPDRGKNGRATTTTAGASAAAGSGAAAAEVVGGGRGCYEGPHVELPGRISRHKCCYDEYLVS